MATYKVMAGNEGDKLMDVTNEILEEAKKEMLKRIKDRTPVDTGRARDGWYINTDGDIANPHEYVKYLEFGSSDQAPQGMVRITALEAESIIKQMARKA